MFSPFSIKLTFLPKEGVSIIYMIYGRAAGEVLFMGQYAYAE